MDHMKIINKKNNDNNFDFEFLLKNIMKGNKKIVIDNKLNE